jgi:hypothetical protein
VERLSSLSVGDLEYFRIALIVGFAYCQFHTNPNFRRTPNRMALSHVEVHTLTATVALIRYDKIVSIQVVLVLCP